MLPLSHLCGPLQEALIISIPDEGEPVASFHSAQKIIVLGFWSHLCKWTLSRHE
jgi:hypothetical protein